MVDWEKMRSAPEWEPILVQAKWRFSAWDDRLDKWVDRWSQWYIFSAVLVNGRIYRFPGDWQAEEFGEIVARRWMSIPDSLPVPKIDQFRMKIGRVEADARREHERRISLGMKDD